MSSGWDHEHIAKEIVLKMLETKSIIRAEYPEAKTTADVVAEVYKKILTAVREG